MQLQPENPDLDRRTLIFFDNGIFSTKTEEKIEKEYEWNTFKQVKKFFSNISAYIKSDKNGNIEVQVDPNADVPLETIQKALLEYIGIDENNINPKVWRKLPETVIDRFKDIISNEEKLFKKSWANKGEVALSGELFGSREIQIDSDWSIQFESVEFSNSCKEPEVGADIALIIHIKDLQGGVGIKTIWFQAKKAENKDEKISNFKDLKVQIDKMRKTTKESFPLLYTKHGPFVKTESESIDNNGKKIEEEQSIEYSKFIANALRCNHGDQRIKVLLDSIDRSSVFSVSIEKLRRKRTPKKKSTT